MQVVENPSTIRVDVTHGLLVTDIIGFFVAACRESPFLKFVLIVDVRNQEFIEAGLAVPIVVFNTFIGVTATGTLDFVVDFFSFAILFGIVLRLQRSADSQGDDE